MTNEHWDKAFYCEAFILVPVDEIPKKDYSNRKGIMDLPVEEWKWYHFSSYFFTRYNQLMPEPHPWVNFGQLKGKIAPSLALRGNFLFKEMIDFVFRERKDYPEWKRVSLDLVCGDHHWSNHIAEAVRLQLRWKGVYIQERLIPSKGEEEEEDLAS